MLKKAELFVKSEIDLFSKSCKLYTFVLPINSRSKINPQSCVNRRTVFDYVEKRYSED